MSSRITRSAARLAADSLPVTASDPSPSASASGPTPSRKRKPVGRRDPAQDISDQLNPTSPPRRAKRQRLTDSSHPITDSAASRRGARSRPTMSQPGPSSRPTEEHPKSQSSPPSSRRRSSRHGKISRDNSLAQSPPRRQKKRPIKSADVIMKEADEELESRDRKADRDSSLSGSNDDTNQSGLDEDEADPFSSSLFGPGLQTTLRALSGMMSGMSTRLRDILCNLRMKADPSAQLIALQELSDLLLVSNEDNLSGQFSPDPYVKELVALMQPSELGGENPEIMLLACRCLANLMEALRGSVANVVYGGAVPILCQKLLDIQFIDLAEQALSTLSKISVDFPASIVREGGLTACLTYLDFFPTSTQRTAVTTAANCCRNLPHDSFPVVRDVMPTLLNVLSSNDPKVVEQGCLCVSRIVESYKYKPEKLEELMEPAMLKAVLRLLLPGTANLVGPHIHTQFLRVLAIAAKSSPRLSVELLKMDVVDTVYQILTGVSPPGAEVSSNKMDSVQVMQALIHRPREQIFETLNVICELLPSVRPQKSPIDDGISASCSESAVPLDSKSFNIDEMADKRRALLINCKAEVKRFAMVLLPTLVDTYSSTVNLGVRQKVLSAQLKLLSNLDTSLIEGALRSVPYASFIAAILSQKDHPALVSSALRCAELLLQRLGHVYQRQFHREGVISEIVKLAEETPSGEGQTLESSGMSEGRQETKPGAVDECVPARIDSTSDNEQGGSEDNDDDIDDYPDEENDDDISGSESCSSFSSRQLAQKQDTDMRDSVIRGARAFLATYEAGETCDMRDKAADILSRLQSLATDIGNCYLTGGSSDGLALFKRLASYFTGDNQKSITSSELLNSGIIKALLDVFDSDRSTSAKDARSVFLQAFMDLKTLEMSQSQSTTGTPFSMLIRKLQDLLSRTEHYEVTTINNNMLENTRSSPAYMLGKQLKLKLIADNDFDIPRSFRSILVSIHAIATFKSLDDFLRPRFSLSERPRSSRNREAILSQLANAARLRDQLASNSEMPSSTSQWPPATPSPLPSSGQELTNVAEGQPAEDRQPVYNERSEREQPTLERSNLSPLPLECPDEGHAGEEDESDELEDDSPGGGDAEREGLNSIVDDLDDGISGNSVHDPTAVNMEVTATGKVTARTEDGTHVATPSQSTPASKLPSGVFGSNTRASGGSSAGIPSRSFPSYAAAIASRPEDWHLEFSINGEPVTNDTTIYRAVHQSLESAGAGTKNVWTSTHTVKFRRAAGPPPPESTVLSRSESEPVAGSDSREMPLSLSKDVTTASILQLLRVLHEMNSALDDILAEGTEGIVPTSEPLVQFVNTKLTAKLNRQLEEPLIVASNCLPSWNEDLARLFPFLFPFETRHLFLQSTAFGYSRAMTRWQNSQNGDDHRSAHRRDDRPFLGRLQRQKVRISRTRILESAVKVMELYGSSPSVLEVEYFEEVGTGLGPTLEFYSTVSREFCKKKLKMWRENDSKQGSEYSFGKRGLFPAPMSDKQAGQELGRKQLHLFKALGKFVARSMLDSRIIDISFNPAFFRIADSSCSSLVAPSLGTVRAVDQDLASSLCMLRRFASARKAVESDKTLSQPQKSMALRNVKVDGARVEDLGLDFTLPGYPSIELIKDGSNTPVTIENIDLYIDRVIDMTLGGGVSHQMEAFRTGFSQVFPFSALRTFTPNELSMLFGQAEEDWSIETLMDSIKADHGFNMDSRSVRNLLQTMSELNTQQRRDFLQFVTGSPKLPIGGFKGLTPIFTVVCRPSEPPYTPDDYLPSVMTCVNYLKLPDYSNLEVLRERLYVAIKEGQGAFHLS